MLEKEIHIYIPFEQKQVDVVVLLGEEIPKNSGWVARSDLVGWQSKVQTLKEVKHLGGNILGKLPVIIKYNFSFNEDLASMLTYILLSLCSKPCLHS